MNVAGPTRLGALSPGLARSGPDIEARQFVVIGGGARGLYFSEILHNELGCTVVGIVEPFEAGEAFVRNRLAEASIDDVTIFADLDTALDAYPSETIDGVFIMTPEWTHAAIFKEVTARGYNVFLEKPIATTRDDALAIREIAARYPKVIQLGFVLRYSAFYRKAKELLGDGALGRIVTIQMSEHLTVEHGVKFKRSWHRLVEYTGGYLNEKCSHDLDLMCWFKEHEAEPVRVASMGNRGFATRSLGEVECESCTRSECLYRDIPTSYDKYVDGRVLLDDTAAGIGRCIYGNDSDIHDNQSVLVGFSDGSHGVFSSVAMSRRHGRDLLVHCEYGVVWGQLEAGELHRTDYRSGITEDFSFAGMDMHGGGDTQVVREFVECIADATMPVASVSDGVRATLVALAADESIRRNEMVDVGL